MEVVISRDLRAWLLFASLFIWLAAYALIWSKYRREGERWDAFLRAWYLPFDKNRFVPEAKLGRRFLIAWLLLAVLPAGISFVLSVAS